jgi:hypothetical protein
MIRKKEVKKISGIVLALALVLSMGVMATPVSAAHDITVTVTNPLAGSTGDYTITFTMQQPLDAGEYIDITFPSDPVIAGITEVEVYGTDSNGVVHDLAGANWYSRGAGDLAVVQIGNTLRITLTGVGAQGPPGDLIAGVAHPVTVIIYGATHPPEQCFHTLWVGTSQETASESPQYNIFLYKFCLRAGWNLISLPCIPEDPDIKVVLADLIAREETACEPPFSFRVYFYDCATWYAFNNDSYASLTEMTECHAYWIWVSDDICFYIKCEYYPAPPGPPLKKCYHECWNMVGFTSNVNRDPFVPALHAWAAYMASLAPPDTVAYIVGWDAVAQDWDPVIQGVDDLVVGQGYWMSFTVDACFTPPPPGT